MGEKGGRHDGEILGAVETDVGAAVKRAGRPPLADRGQEGERRPVAGQEAHAKERRRRGVKRVRRNGEAGKAARSYPAA